MPNDAAITRINEKLRARTQRHAEQGHDINVRLHREAPRGGEALNVFGQPRSAPGEPPAPEYGTLLDLITLSFAQTGVARYAWVTNYAALEYGSATANRVLLPRPMGRLTIEEMKRTPLV